MEITLEKIELVKDRTGVTYREAKEALEAADGSVVDAIIDIEESINYDSDDAEDGSKSNELFEKIKKTAEKGNMARIVVKKDDEILLNFPLTVSILGAVVAPWGVIFGLIAAAGFNCKIEFVNDKGEVTDVNGKVKTSYGKAVNKGQQVKDKSQDTFDKFKESDFYNDFREKSTDAIDKIKESDFYNDFKEKSTDAFDEFKDKSADAVEDLRDKSQETLENLGVKDNIDEIKNKGKDLFRKKADREDDQDMKPVVDVEDASADVDSVVDEIEKESGLTDDHEEQK